MTAIESDKNISEFGAGVVICLVKFSEHLGNHLAENVSMIGRWEKMSARDRERAQRNAQKFPTGDDGRLVGTVGFYHRIADRDTNATPLGHAIHAWAAGASDHFYDLHSRAPQPLQHLAALTLRMGHGFSETHTKWTWGDWEHVHDLWKDATIAVEKMLGIEGDWGQW